MSCDQAPNIGYENQFLSSTVRKLYLNTSTADVYFVFGDKLKSERVPAHKNLLGAGSDALKAMLYGEMREEGDVEIIDATVSAFQEFLQFFYLDQVQLTMENIYDVVNLGKKYDVPACLNICENFLNNSLTNDNACFSYGLAILFELKDLRKSCETVIAGNTIEVFQTTSFLECDRSVLSHILKMDTLSCAETKVFHACMAWVKAKAEEEQVTKEMIQIHLGDLFFDIRFGSMTIEEFTVLLNSYGNLFSSDEYQDIVQMIVTKDFLSKLFKRDPRQIRWNEADVIECSRVKIDHSTSTCSLQDVESTIFSTNKSILLGEIVCAQINLRNVGNELATELVVIQMPPDEMPKIVIHEKTVLKSEARQIVSLERPILIKPDFMYEIQFKQSPGDSQFFPRPTKPEAEIPDTGIVIKFREKPSSRGLVNLVAALRFNQIASDA